MDKQSAINCIAAATYIACMPKEAKFFDEKAMEHEMGTFFTPEQKARVVEMVERARQNSVALRHPVLTGLPTLGIWPLHAKEKATEGIAREMAGQDPEVGKRYYDRQHQLLMQMLAAPY